MALLRKKEAAAFVSRTTVGLQLLVAADPTFPRPIKLGTHRQAPVYFDSNEINGWIEMQKGKRKEVAA